MMRLATINPLNAHTYKISWSSFRFDPKMLAFVHKAPLRNPIIRPLLRSANTRHFFSTTMAGLQVSPRFSKGTDEATALSGLQSLLSSDGGRWMLTSEGEALERSFKFKTFAKTWVR